MLSWLPMQGFDGIGLGLGWRFGARGGAVLVFSDGCGLLFCSLKGKDVCQNKKRIK